MLCEIITATARAKYIADAQAKSPILGSEWHKQHGEVLLRVTGKLKASDEGLPDGLHPGRDLTPSRDLTPRMPRRLDGEGE